MNPKHLKTRARILLRPFKKNKREREKRPKLKRTRQNLEQMQCVPDQIVVGGAVSRDTTLSVAQHP